MKTKDYITLILSILAFCISASSFYFSNLRIKDHLVTKITEIAPSDSDLIADIAFINFGNRQGIVTNMEYRLCKSVNAQEKNNNIWFGDNFKNSETFPFILKPQEMKLIKVKVPFNYIIGNYKNGLAVFDSTNNHFDYQFDLAFWYSTIDSKGVMKLTQGPFIQQVTVSEKSWTSTGPLSKEPSGMNSYPLVSLYDN